MKHAALNAVDHGEKQGLAFTAEEKEKIKAIRDNLSAQTKYLSHGDLDDPGSTVRRWAPNDGHGVILENRQTVTDTQSRNADKKRKEDAAQHAADIAKRVEAEDRKSGALEARNRKALADYSKAKKAYRDNKEHGQQTEAQAAEAVKHDAVEVDDAEEHLKLLESDLVKASKSPGDEKVMQKKVNETRQVLRGAEDKLHETLETALETLDPELHETKKQTEEAQTEAKKASEEKTAAEDEVNPKHTPKTPAEEEADEKKENSDLKQAKDEEKKADDQLVKAKAEKGNAQKLRGKDAKEEKKVKDAESKEASAQAAVREAKRKAAEKEKAAEKRRKMRQARKRDEEAAKAATKKAADLKAKIAQEPKQLNVKLGLFGRIKKKVRQAWDWLGSKFSGW